MQKYQKNIKILLINIDLFKNIKECINIFNDLSNKEYNEKTNIRIFINNSVINCYYKNKKYVIDVIAYFSKLRKRVVSTLENYYNNNENVRLFYSRQLYFIYINIINNEHNKNEDLFKIVSNNLIKKMSKPSITLEKEEEDISNYNNNITLIAEYIKAQLDLNNIKCEDIYEFNKIISEKPSHSNEIKQIKVEYYEYIGIYFYVTDNQEIESLNIFLNLTSKLPINSCFLYCTKNTSSEELDCFLLRSFLCGINSLFCMINTDLLNNIVKRKFILLIKKYSKIYGTKMRSCLLIIFGTQNDDLHDILLGLKNIKIFKYNPSIFYGNDNIKVSLINSSNCGLGKTQMIKNKCINKNTKEKTNYIYFPIGGRIKREDLVKRLKLLPDMTDINTSFTIHFDISQTEDFLLLNEFFFKLLILRKCELNENAIYFDKNIEIIIEIPNDFKNYMTEIKVLEKLKPTTIEDIIQINQSEELTLVASIITMFETNEILNKNYDRKKTNLNLTPQQCHLKILKYLKTLDIDNPNYYQINIFIKVLSDQFLKFSKCEGYYPKILENNASISGIKKQRLINIRKFIINSLIQVTKLFLIGPYEKLIKSQQINQHFYLNDDEKEKSINKSLSIIIDSISFDKINPSLVVFNEDSNSCTVITTCSEDKQEFKDLELLYYTQSIDYQRNRIGINNRNYVNKNFQKLRNFRTLKGNEILDNLLSYLNINGFNENQKKQILGSYVYTPDNFIKVVLILMRLRVKIPVIMMGETGCGKTTLIEMASKLINKGKVYIKKMNIHAGIVDENIIDFINNVNTTVKQEDISMLQEKKEEFDSLPEKTKKDYLKNNSLKKIYEDYENEINNRKIWIFFDEINTCNSMGLLTEIMCNNSIYGQPLDKRYIFIAACNPYRVFEKQNKALNILYKNKKNKKRNLVYAVNPLPLTLLNFVFNFGSLKNEDEKSYIQNMIVKSINNLLGEKNILKESEKKKLIAIEIDLVHICQNYIKKNNDISIVSLREVNRFNRMFEYYVNYINDRKTNIELIKLINDEEPNIYKSKTNLEIYYCAINLSLYICYYLRLPDKESRKELEQIINEKKYFKEDFLSIPLMEQDYLINNFEIPKGIAKNRNLKENIFILFFCIINKIPLITLGKPGRSKTLSFQIIQNSMQGYLSKTTFCRRFPKLMAYKIQGSLHTTSLEILNAFSKARKNQKNDQDKLIVVFMDEMGLAEISENNPLKVLHSELEKENNNISFVGISNWFIDASKMNRVIYNVVQDPDENDIIETAENIAKSYEENDDNYYERYGNILINLSKAYYKYISNKQNENDENQYFHGSRDFYSLIKSIINDIIKNKNKLNELDKEKKQELIDEIIEINIERNFGGLPNSINDFKYYYYEKYRKNNYDVRECIFRNLNDYTSRYLLLIADSNLSKELINFILDEFYENKFKSDNNTGNNIIKEENTSKKDEMDSSIQIINNSDDSKKEDFKKFLSGSKFRADKKNILYSNQMLNKIKYYMETDNILILNDLETVYPNLYELFNQSYTYLEGSKFVYLGDSKSLSLVNDKFKVIVLVNNNLVKYQEPPFLNRFEKHIINFSNLLSEDCLSLADEIFDTLKEMIKINSKNNNIDKEVENKLNKYLFFIKKEEIKGLVYIAIKNAINKDNKKLEKNKVREFILKKISPCFSEELMILITKYGFRNKYNEYYNYIYNSYREKYCYNIKDYLSKLSDDTSIVYTFSSFFEDIIDEDNKIIKNYFLNVDFSKETIYEININANNTMDQIEMEITDFIFDQKNIGNQLTKNLLIIKFREEDLDKFNDIYYLINDYTNNIAKKKFTESLNLSFLSYIYLVVKKQIIYLFY